CRSPREIRRPLGRVGAIRRHQNCGSGSACLQSPDAVNRFALTVTAKHEHARPSLMLWIIFNHDSGLYAAHDIHGKYSVRVELIEAVPRESILAAGHQDLNCRERLAHLMRQLLIKTAAFST